MMTPKEKLFDILKTSDVNWFNSAVNISLKGRFVYVENPKVASSTIKSKLHSNELMSLRGLRVGPHPEITNSPFVKPYQLPTDELSDILFGGDFFRFTFVRNPFHRLLSAYLDKIVGREVEKGQIDSVWKRLNGEMKDSYSFPEFLEGISNIPDINRDRHWRTQSRVILINYIKYSYVGRFEKIKADLQKIQEISSIDFSNISEFSPHKTDANSKSSEYYTEEIASRAFEIYKTDFERFAYDRESLALRPA